MSDPMESSLERLSEPGIPGQPPQPLGEGLDPTAPGAPEGMVRLTLGAETTFCFPCHIDGWQALGWQVHQSGLSPAVDPPLLPPPAPGTAVIEQIHDGPHTIGSAAPGQRVVIFGTDFERGSTVLVKAPLAVVINGLEVNSATMISFQLETEAVPEPCACSIAATNSSGTGPWFTFPLGPEPERTADADDQPLVMPGEPEPAADRPDYAAMTKAQIIAEVERRYGVALDPGMTKVELVAEAERLASGGLTAEAEPDSRGELPALPLDLLR